MITFKKKFDFLATDNELGSYISSMLEVVEGDIDPQIEFDVESDDQHRYVIVNILDKVSLSIFLFQLISYDIPYFHNDCKSQ